MIPSLRNSLVVASGVFAFVSIVMSGCSDDPEEPTTTTEAGPFCPANLAAALDSKTTCVGEGFECPIGYKCDSFDQQALCKCTKGKFVCTSGRGEAITNPDQPPCTPVGPGSDKECPQSQTDTDGKSCKTPGLQCFYTGFTCPESPDAPKVDVCQCLSHPTADGGPSLAFKCEIKYCNPKSDAAIPQPPKTDSAPPTD